METRGIECDLRALCPRGSSSAKCRATLSPNIGRQNQQPIAAHEGRVWIRDEQIAIQIGGNRRVQAVVDDQLAERGETRRQPSEQLTEGISLNFEFGDAGALARDAEK